MNNNDDVNAENGAIEKAFQKVAKKLYGIEQLENAGLPADIGLGAVLGALGGFCTMIVSLGVHNALNISAIPSEIFMGTTLAGSMVGAHIQSALHIRNSTSAMFNENCQATQLEYLQQDIDDLRHHIAQEESETAALRTKLNLT